MKLFLQKTLVVMLAVIITSLFVKGIIQVGDTTITNEASKNYNGYFVKEDEDYLISIGAIYYDEVDFKGYYLFSGIVTPYYYIFKGTYVIDLSTYYDQYGPVGFILLHMYETYYFQLQYITQSGTVYINNIDDQIRIYGISNYEVTP